jgi:hypothetical protein
LARADGAADGMLRRAKVNQLPTSEVNKTGK